MANNELFLVLTNNKPNDQIFILCIMLCCDDDDDDDDESGFYRQSATKRHAKLTLKVTKKQTADKSRLKTNSTKVMMF